MDGKQTGNGTGQNVGTVEAQLTNHLFDIQRLAGQIEVAMLLRNYADAEMMAVKIRTHTRQALELATKAAR